MFIKFSKSTILLFFLLLTYASFAQNNTENIDQKTLELFQNKQYKRLIFTGEEAIKNGTDYFFLRLRIGIAYYELKNFRMSAYHLEKASGFNSDDPTELEYLYYSYLFSGRFSDANFLTSKMTDELKAKLAYKTRLLSSIYVEGGVSLCNNIANNSGIDINGVANIYGENDMNNNILFGHIGLKHEILPFLSIYQGVSHISLDKQKIISFHNQDTVHNYQLTQNEYYINSDIQLKKGLKLTPAFHFMNVKATGLKFDTTNYFSTYKTDALNINNYVVSLAISKEYKKLTLSLSGSYSNLNSAKQIQSGISIAYYPFGNLDLYTNSSLVFFYQKNPGRQGGNNESRIIIDQMIGLKLFSKLWAETSFTIGDLANYNEKNAFIVYNIADKINFKAGISFIYTLSSKIELSLRYQLLKRESAYMTLDASGQILKEIINTSYYQNNTIVGGIKWKI